jgi:hypothetical protein
VPLKRKRLGPAEHAAPEIDAICTECEGDAPPTRSADDAIAVVNFDDRSFSEPPRALAGAASMQLT